MRIENYFAKSEGRKITRLELYHNKPKQIHWKGPLFFILSCLILSAGVLVTQQYWQKTIRIEAPEENLGKKVVVHLPNGSDVFTYEKLIVKKEGKTFYKGERNTIDLTGGTVTYENWGSK
ncbi:hypothetical protein [Neobacillus sp. PS3-40]|uniref:hypothetical protein n=1 Tax=Neobacillus sp. PS3-40 TaxID=3070679 RepID=UPI0027E00894|nr:hypothetical protein [Neobacillus sp. PS3-40]WML44154.1 hypothetical protein RCG20_20635 [Neobacillus sp. PS3-40]